MKTRCALAIAALVVMSHSFAADRIAWIKDYETALAQAKRQGIRTIGFAGYDGGGMAQAGLLDVLIVAPSSYIPRIQEAHATAYHTLLCMMHALLQEKDAA